MLKKSLFVMAAIVLIAQLVNAQVPQLINYQGVLINPTTGEPIPDGTYTIVFSIYNVATSGSSIWTETQSVETKDGVYNVLLGSITALQPSVLDSPEKYLGIKVGSDPEMTPRRRIVSVAYAIICENAHHLGGKSAMAFADTNHHHDDHYYTKTELDTSDGDPPNQGSNRVSWDNLTDMPAGFADGVDNVGGGGGGWVDDGTVVRLETNTDKVGIGTTSPEATLELSVNYIGGPTPNLLRLTDENDDDPFISFYSGSTYKSHIGYSNGVAHWGTNDGSDLAIQGYGQAGNLGIGTTSPSEETKLHIRTSTDHNFGVLVDAGGTSGSEIGLHSAHNKYASLVKNAYFVPYSWHRFDTNSGAFLEEILPGGDVLFRMAGAGANPISWTNVLTLRTNGTVECPVLKITGGSDIAEPFDIRETDIIKAGMVLTIDPENPGNLKISQRAYDRRVAGITSGAGGIEPGMLMGQSGSVTDGEYPVALTGRVYCWADASNGPIQPGDLLTTSDTPGHAMKVTDYTRAQGAILGKAMSSLEEGQDLVLVLVTLQ